MEPLIDKEAVEHLEAIEEELKELSDHTSSKRAFLNGILQGMGAVGGSLAAIALIGWLLHFLGLIPGFGDIGQYIEGLVSRVND